MTHIPEYGMAGFDNTLDAVSHAMSECEPGSPEQIIEQGMYLLGSQFRELLKKDKLNWLSETFRELTMSDRLDFLVSELDELCAIAAGRKPGQIDAKGFGQLLTRAQLVASFLEAKKEPKLRIVNNG